MSSPKIPNGGSFTPRISVQPGWPGPGPCTGPETRATPHPVVRGHLLKISYRRDSEVNSSRDQGSGEKINF